MIYFFLLNKACLRTIAYLKTGQRYLNQIFMKHYNPNPITIKLRYTDKLEHEKQFRRL